jgi:hypothetical protein
LDPIEVLASDSCHHHNYPGRNHHHHSNHLHHSLNYLDTKATTKQFLVVSGASFSFSAVPPSSINLLLSSVQVT